MYNDYEVTGTDITRIPDNKKEEIVSCVLWAVGIVVVVSLLIWFASL